MSKRYGKMEEMSTADLGFSLEDVRARSLDEVARMGAKLVLEVAMGEDLADCLTFYRFPEMHWKRLRTSNVIERAFREVRRRTNVVGRFPSETAALTLIWATLEQDRLKWRGVQMDADLLKAVVALRKEGFPEIDLSVLDMVWDAA